MRPMKDIFVIGERSFVFSVACFLLHHKLHHDQDSYANAVMLCTMLSKSQYQLCLVVTVAQKTPQSPKG